MHKKKRATPKAKKYAKENNIDISTIHGSGECGAVVFSDVFGLKNTKITKLAGRMADYYNIDISQIDNKKGKIRKTDIENISHSAKIEQISQKRKELAENISQTFANTAAYTEFTELDTTVFMDCYHSLKSYFSENFGVRLTFTDMLIYAVSRVLMDAPKFNSSIVANRLYSYNNVNLSLAVSVEGGLVAPVITRANTLSLSEIAARRKRLVEMTQNKTLTNDMLSNGTFTLSNLGNSLITYFMPVINYPQSAILGVGRSEQKPLVVGGEILIRYVTYFSLTMDHYVLDGADGADFFELLNGALNRPQSFYNI